MDLAPGKAEMDSVLSEPTLEVLGMYQSSPPAQTYNTVWLGSLLVASNSL